MYLRRMYLRRSYVLTMECKGLFSRIFKGFSAFALLCLFLYWSYYAIDKFLDEPISTQISYRFGDDDKGLIEFPAVSICPLRAKVLAEKFLNCPQDSFDSFDDMLFRCFAKNSDFTIDEMVKHLDIQREDYVDMQPFKTYADKLNGNAIDTSLGWRTVYSVHFGTCFIFDSKQVPGYEKQNISNIQGNPKMKFKLLDKNYNYKIILNSGYDHLDGRDLYPNFEASVNASLVGNMKKKTIVRVKSTKHFCQEKAMQTCA